VWFKFKLEKIKEKKYKKKVVGQKRTSQPFAKDSVGHAPNS